MEIGALFIFQGGHLFPLALNIYQDFQITWGKELQTYHQDKTNTTTT